MMLSSLVITVEHIFFVPPKTRHREATALLRDDVVNWKDGCGDAHAT
jgi:hypothetical protein